jgi:hypothetical protein
MSATGAPPFPHAPRPLLPRDHGQTRQTSRGPGAAPLLAHFLILVSAAPIWLASRSFFQGNQ